MLGESKRHEPASHPGWEIRRITMDCFAKMRGLIVLAPVAVVAGPKFGPFGSTAAWAFCIVGQRLRGIGFATVLCHAINESSWSPTAVIFSRSTSDAGAAGIGEITSGGLSSGMEARPLGEVSQWRT